VDLGKYISDCIDTVFIWWKTTWRVHQHFIFSKKISIPLHISSKA